jgi:hypothetical protein
MTYDDPERALQRLGDRLHEVVDRELERLHALGAFPAARVGSRDDLAGVGSANLSNQISELDRAGSLAATLDALVQTSSTMSSRVALLLVHRSRWWRRASGFDLTRDLPVISSTRLGIVADALNRKKTIVATDSSAMPPFAGHAAKAVACPLLLAGDAVAVLYADSGPEADGRTVLDEPSIEILCSHAARKLEALVAFMAARHMLDTATGRQTCTEAQAP